MDNFLKEYYWLYLPVIIFIGYVSIKNMKSSDEKEIISLCSDCIKFEKIPKTNWILTTKKNQLSNVYNTESNRFLLSNWYIAVFDKGVFYDDITFTVNNTKVSCTEANYNNLSDTFLLEKIKPKIKSSSNYKINCYCTKSKKCYKCIEKDFKKELNKKGGFRDKVSRY